MNIRISWPVLGLAVLAAAVAVAGVLQLGSPASAVRTERELVTAADGVVQSTVTGTGNVEPATEVAASFQSSGVLQSLQAKVGQHVLKGQLLGALDPTSAQLTVEQAQSSLTAADDQLANAENEASAAASASSYSPTASSSATAASAAPRTARSSGSTGATAQSADSLAAAVASAQAAVDGAQASLHQAQAALSQTRLFAPVSGTVVSVADVSPGDTVSAGGSGSGSGSGSSGSGSSAASSSSSSTSSSGLVEIASAGRLAMTVSFSESDIGKIHVGQPATVTLDALSGVELPARVTSISPLGSSSSGVVSYDATVTLSSGDRRVRPGMSASASVITAQASGVNLPSSAVTGTRGTVSHVEVMDGDHEVSTPVIVGLVGDSRTQIVSGLRRGQQVAITETLPSLSAVAAAAGSTLGTSRFGGAGFGGAGLGGGGFGGGLRRALGAARGGG